jgi:hypothetical protein
MSELWIAAVVGIGLLTLVLWHSVRRRWSRQARFAGRLGVSEAQSTELRKLFEEFRPKAAPFREERRAVHDELAQLFRGEQLAAADVERVLVSRSERLGQAISVFSEMLASAHGVLDPAQRERLALRSAQLAPELAFAAGPERRLPGAYRRGHCGGFGRHWRGHGCTS